MRVRATFLLALELGWSLLSPPTGRADDVVYDNTSRPLNKVYAPAGEFGDEVVLRCPYGSVRSCTLTGIALDLVSGTSGQAQGRLRLYLNDGPLGPGGARQPGTRIYDSGPLNFPASTTPITVRRDRLQLRGVPGSLTWTMEFWGLSGSEPAGLLVYSPPTVGLNYDDFWERSGTNWLLKRVAGSPMSFGAILFATEVVPTDSLPVTLEVGAPIEGAGVVRVLGPSARQYVLEASENLRSWRVVTNFTSTASQTTCRDPGALASRQRFYRVWRAYPQAPAVRVDIARGPGPGARLTVTGQPGRLYAVEQSSDLTWWEGWTNFVSSEAATLLPWRAEEGTRFFRVRQ